MKLAIIIFTLLLCSCVTTKRVVQNCKPTVGPSDDWVCEMSIWH